VWVADGRITPEGPHDPAKAHHTSLHRLPCRRSAYLAAIAEVWRRGSVVSSWLLDLLASALRKGPDLAGFSGHVSDSGEGRWTLKAAVDEGAPAPVIATALFSRFSSRGEAEYEDKLLSALRFEFGGHVEKKGE